MLSFRAVTSKHPLYSLVLLLPPLPALLFPVKVRSMTARTTEATKAMEVPKKKGEEDSARAKKKRKKPKTIQQMAEITMSWGGGSPPLLRGGGRRRRNISPLSSCALVMTV